METELAAVAAAASEGERPENMDKKRGYKPRQIDDFRISVAINRLLTGVYTSKQATDYAGCSDRTIQRRMKGGKNAFIGTNEQSLLMSLDTTLDYFNQVKKVAYSREAALTKVEALALARTYFELEKPEQSPRAIEYDWVSKMAKYLGALLQQFTEFNEVVDWFKEVFEPIKNVDPNCLYNMGQTNCQVGIFDSYLVATDDIGVNLPVDKKEITVIECLNAAGTLLNPYVAINDSFKDTLGAGEPDPPCLEWITQFHKQTLNQFNRGETRHIIIDEQNGHLNKQFLKKAKSLNIKIVILPPHMCQLLQPIDGVLFGPLKRNFNHFLQFDSEVSGLVREHYDEFWHQEYSAKRLAINHDFRQSLWREIGFYPYSPANFEQTLRGLHRPSDEVDEHETEINLQRLVDSGGPGYRGLGTLPELAGDLAKALGLEADRIKDLTPMLGNGLRTLYNIANGIINYEDASEGLVKIEPVDRKKEHKRPAIQRSESPSGVKPGPWVAINSPNTRGSSSGSSKAPLKAQDATPIRKSSSMQTLLKKHRADLERFKTQLPDMNADLRVDLYADIGKVLNKFPDNKDLQEDLLNLYKTLDTSIGGVLSTVTKQVEAYQSYFGEMEEVEEENE
ncbi:hypothetical protein TRVA0_024S00606 [Trichomonascus vanleenenianus]|uniref:uncharacterized protein n=1 Tax=Trichomonascus vanleenenianus TaxID=2268995 RepID=UPI003EC9F42A